MNMAPRRRALDRAKCEEPPTRLYRLGALRTAWGEAAPTFSGGLRRSWKRLCNGLPPGRQIMNVLEACPGLNDASPKGEPRRPLGGGGGAPPILEHQASCTPRKPHAP